MKDIVVLFSGGLDSVACLHWAQQNFTEGYIVRPMYVDFGQQYATKEIVAAMKICAANNLICRVVHINKLLTENKIDAHIPMRNTMLLILASVIYPEAEGVVFGMLRGESCEDKNPYYVHLMQQLFDSQFKPSIYRTDKREFCIHTPFELMTKTQTLRWLYDCTSVSRREIDLTIGCYSPDYKNCGDCISCFNRWVARYNTGLPDEDYGECHPYHSMLYKASFALVKKHRKNNHLFSLRQIWLKRMWVLESYFAMDKFARTNYQKGLITAIRDEQQRSELV